LILLIKVEDTIPLRHSVLWPERDVSYVSLPEDAQGYHFGAFLSNLSSETPIGIISLFLTPIPHSENNDGSPKNSEHHGSAARFRKFACHPAYQRRKSIFQINFGNLTRYSFYQGGIGTKLLENVFSVAFSKLGVTVVWCDARTTSINWYQSRGMTPFGGLFRKGGLEYIRMQKSS
jgi:hypothetical protein